MRNILSLSALSLFTALAAGQSISPPYSSTMYGQESGWTTVNVDENTNTWTDDDYARDFSDTPYSEGKEFKDRRKQADDWLISPAIRMDAGREYKVSFWLQVETGYDQVSLSWAGEASVEALSADNAILFDYETEIYDWVRYSVVVTPASSGDYYFGFHVYTPENRGYVYLTGFEVKENTFMPGKVTSLSVTPDINGGVETTVSWALPVTDADGIALPDDVVFENIKVCRDGAPVAELPGTALSFIDSAALGLTAGKHLYSVTVTANGVTSAPAEVTSRHIGPLTTENLPWTADLENLSKEDFQTYYAVIKGENSTVPADKGWMKGYECIEFRPGSSVNREDDWLILPKMNFEHTGVYRFRVNADYDSRVSPSIALYKGNSRSIESMIDHIATFESLPSYAGDVDKIFRIDQPGEYYLALYAGREKADSNTTITFYEFSVEETVARPEAVSGLVIEIADDTVTLSWTAPTLMNTGEEIESFDNISIFRNDELLDILTENLVPGEKMQFADSPGQAGIFRYSVVPTVGGYSPEALPAVAATPWLGDKLQQIPYTLDFTDNVDLEAQKALWTVFDNNRDSYTWSVKKGGLTLDFDYWDECDDMLLSPPLMIEPGDYTVGITIKGGESGFPVQIGFVAENDDTRSLRDAGSIELNGKNVFADHVLTISTAADGRHHLAFHTTAEYGYDPYDVVIQKVSLTRDRSTGVMGVSDPDSSIFTCYDLQGRRIENPRKGTVCILVDANGNARKAIIR